MRKRKLLLFLLLVISSGVLAGCHLHIGWIGTERTASMTARYTYCRDLKQRSVDLRAGDKLDLSYNIKVTSGKVGLLITNPSGEAIYQRDLEESAQAELTINADADGEYTVQLDLQGTRGSYAVSWVKQP